MKRSGTCALCGKECILTFEHIPPRAASNSAPAKPVTGKTMLFNPDRNPWEIEGLPFENQQRGMGLNSLCKECNQNTGHWYGSDYTAFAKTIIDFEKSKPDPDFKSIEIKNVRPLRIVKQVLSMFCSINPKLELDDLRKLVLNKTAIGIDKQKYKLCMFFTHTNVIRYMGINTIMNVKDGSSTTQSEITAYPFGFILYFDPKENQVYKGIDITRFADSEYDDVCNIKMPLLFHEVNSWLPLDYRSKAEILGVDSN